MLVRVMRATSVVAVSLLALGSAWGADKPAAALREQVHRPDPDEAAVALTLPGGARIGVIDLLNTDITHFHTGRGGGNNTFMRTYSVRWPLAEEVDQPLANAIQSAGFTAVPTAASDLLRKQREAWFLSTTRSNKLTKACAQELARSAADGKLDAIVVVAPGFNDSPQAVEGTRLRQLPQYVQGWGFTTVEDDRGSMNPVLFNLTQILLIEITPDGAKLRHREWGGAYLYDWVGFTPPPDLRSLPDAEVEKLRPLVADILSRQTTRLLTHLARTVASQ